MQRSNKRKSTEEFVRDAKLAHGDFYDYSKTVYRGAGVHVTITCPRHGEISQQARLHLKSGCPRCGYERYGQTRAMTLAYFLEKSAQVHGTFYKYDKVQLSKGTDRVTISCQLHGDFQQQAVVHLQDHGCSECANEVRKKKLTEYFIAHQPPTGQLNVRSATTEIFITRAKEIHGDRYSYERVVYTNNHTPVIIHCSKHGDFEQIPNGHLDGKHGCPKCGAESTAASRLRGSLDEFIRQATIVHGTRYCYDSVDYIGSTIHVEIICLTHGIFLQEPYYHLAGKGCKKCADEAHGYEQRKTMEAFVADARKIHGDRYNYDAVVYETCEKHVLIGCSKHGFFQQIPDSHLRGSGCRACFLERLQLGYSQKALDWLTSITLKEGTFICHAENGGERIVQGLSSKWYHVDGYCEATDTVYEFHGTYWHADPRVRNPDDIHPHQKKKQTTNKAIYEKTLRRDHDISGSHKLVVMWEKDYDSMQKTT